MNRSLGSLMGYVYMGQVPEMKLMMMIMITIKIVHSANGVARIYFRRGGNPGALGDRSPPVVSRGEAPVGVWGEVLRR